MKQNRSLKFALLKSIAIPLIAYLLIIRTVSFYSEKQEIAEVYDAHLITAANVLYFLTQKELSENDGDDSSELDITDKLLDKEEREIFDKHAEWRMFRIWMNGRMVWTSDDDIPASIPPFAHGFTNGHFNNNDWRIFSLHVPDQNIIVEVAEQQQARQYLLLSIQQKLLWPFLLSLPIAAWLFMRALDHGLSGLHRVTRQIHARSPELMEHLDTEQMPSDLMPLVEAINSLLSRLASSLERERQLTDHAAHELRTPLAVLRLKAQMAMRAKNDEERDKALGSLLLAVDRATHLSEQLLTLARIRQQHYPLETFDITAMARKVISEMQVLVDQRHIQLRVTGDASLHAQANPMLLQILLTNIIGNAIKYSPVHGEVLVNVTRLDNQVIMVITDNGPGIPPESHEKVFERFARLDVETNGSGLGLTIARQCAELMDAAIILDTPANGIGLCVRIAFQAA